MSGICGIAGLDDNRLLKRMSTAIRHRGPDKTGIFSATNVGLCARGLQSNKPGLKDLVVYNENKDICAVADARLEGWRQLKLQLQEKGHRFYTDADLEIIPHLYEEFQEKGIAELSGSFALAIWDKRKARLILARDKLGLKPLYYTFDGRNLIFASEIKPILEYPTLKRAVDLEALSDFLSFLYIPSPRTMFAGIKKLTPASILVYAQNNLNITRYWDLSVGRPSHQSKEFYELRLSELLKRSISAKLINDTQVGVFLSGGLDSSGIVALLKEMGTRTIRTFSIGYTGKDKSFNELNYAHLVADHFRCEHYEYIVTAQKASGLLVNLVRHMEEPFGNSSALVTYLVCQKAKEAVSFAFSGLGADELFAGSRKYIAAKFMRLYQNLPLSWRKKLILNLVKQLPESTQSRNLAGWIKGFAERGVIPAERLPLSWFSFFNGKTKQDLFSPELKNLCRQREYIDNLPEAVGARQSENFLNQMFYLDVKTWLGDNLLVLADKMSMANSLDLYLPFCNDRLLELSASIPFALKIKGLSSKYILTKALGRLLPAPILHRKRQGFTVPIGRWLKDEFKDVALMVLNKAEIECQGYFNYEYIANLLQQHFQGRRNFADQLWALLTFELWHKLFVQSSLYKDSSLSLLEDIYP